MSFIDTLVDKIKNPSLGVGEATVSGVVDTIKVVSLRERTWRSKFQVQPIIYRAQNNLPRDVRTFLFDKSCILEQCIIDYKLKGTSDSDTTYKIVMWVIDHLKYTGDDELHKQIEFWQDPEETIATLKGDCEDGAILIKSLTLAAGVPDWKIKIMAGNVTGGGHAYCVYIREDEAEVILDWCYWPNRLPIASRPDRATEKNYQEIWFNFDRMHGYAPKPIEYSLGKIN
jgi:hypothetical protein